LILVLSPSAEGNKVPAGEDDDHAAAVKIQVIRKLFFLIIFLFFAFNLGRLSWISSSKRSGKIEVLFLFDVC
jgi:hypothetical protein